MLQKFSENSFIMGAASSIIAVICFSINDVAIKFLSGNYALHQIVLFRSIIGLFFLLFFILPFSGGWKALSTKRLGIHLLRGCCVVFANMSFFLCLAALPLAEGVAIFFISPMVITIFFGDLSKRNRRIQTMACNYPRIDWGVNYVTARH